MIKRFIPVLLAVLVVASLALLGCDGATTNTSHGVNLTQMAADITALKSNVSVIQSALSAIQTNTGGVKQAEFDSLKSQFTALQTQVNALQTPSGYVTSEQLTALQTQVTQAQNSVNDFQAQLTTLSNQIAALQNKDADLQVQLDALKARVMALETPATTTPPTTLTAAEAIEVSITTLTGGSFIEVPIAPADTVANYFLTLKYKNTSGKQFTNVKFSLKFYTTYITFNTTTGMALTTLSTATPLWALTMQVPNTYYYYQSVTGITVNANAEGELVLQLSIKYGATVIGMIMPQAVVL